jgi:phosphatidate cytidylyltransferase
MALNLKTLATRSASAAVFVVLLIGSVLWNQYSFAAFFFIVALIGLNEFFRIAEQLEVKPVKILSFLIAIVLYLLALPSEINGINSDYFFPVLVFSFFVILSTPIFLKNRTITDAFFTLSGILYALVPFALLNRIADNGGFSPLPLLGVILLIWCNDTFAYLGGSLYGKNKMIERISPGKTWEGTLTGILVTLALSFVFPQNFTTVKPHLWLILGFTVPILATIGDLVESKLKREAAVKDSGSIMPGHGGVLDRFDSLIFVSPFIYLIFKYL